MRAAAPAAPMRPALALLLLLLAGCTEPAGTGGDATGTPSADPCDPAPVEGSLTDGALASPPPGNATIDGRRVRMEVSAWRDFMPGPDQTGCGTHLRVVADLWAEGEAPFPEDARPRMAWVTRGQQSWTVPVETMEGAAPNATRARADGGPRWDEGDGLSVALLVETPEGLVRVDAQTTVFYTA